MEQYGLVSENKGETAIVNLQRHLACEGCGRCGLMSGAKKKETIIEALNPIRAEAGQRVLLEIDDRRMLFISFMLYLVPLGGLLIGIFFWLAIADNLGLAGNQELTGVGVGLGLMALIFFFIRTWDRRVKGSRQYMPVITDLIEDAQGDSCTGQAEYSDKNGSG